MNMGADDQSTPPGGEPSKFGSLAQSIGARNLIIIIIAMPFFFLVAVMGVIAIFGNPNDRSEDARANEAATIDTTPAAQTGAITYAAGAAPGAIALDGDRLAVRIDSPDGVTVVVYDLAKSEVVARIPLVAEEETPSQ